MKLSEAAGSPDTNPIYTLPELRKSIFADRRPQMADAQKQSVPIEDATDVAPTADGLSIRMDLHIADCVVTLPISMPLAVVPQFIANLNSGCQAALGKSRDHTVRKLLWNVCNWRVSTTQKKGVVALSLCTRSNAEFVFRFEARELIRMCKTILQENNVNVP